MTDQDYRYFKPKLELMRVELKEHDEVARESREIVELDQQMFGRLSRMDALQNQAMAKAAKKRREQLLFRVEAALQRMEDGDYGYCADCGEAIGHKRLEADPTSPKCTSCATGSCD